MNVLVLGCGPSGLVAAHAAAMAGSNVTVWSKRQKSQILGAQFLHQDIPATNSPMPRFVQWLHHPSEEGMYRPEDYLRKVYGDAWDGTISPEMYNTGQQAYDLREIYTHLWNRFKPVIQDWTFSPEGLLELMARVSVSGPFLVINTLPRNVLCQRKGEHSFLSTQIWALGDDPMNGRYCPISIPDFTIEYNGNVNPSWYRVSRIFGYTTMEWPGHMARPPVAGVVPVAKPLATTCTCWPMVAHVGRYGQWRKGVLVHHVYNDTLLAITAARQEARI